MLDALNRHHETSIATTRTLQDITITIDDGLLWALQEVNEPCFAMKASPTCLASKLTAAHWHPPSSKLIVVSGASTSVTEAPQIRLFHSSVHASSHCVNVRDIATASPTRSAAAAGYTPIECSGRCLESKQPSNCMQALNSCVRIE